MIDRDYLDRLVRATPVALYASGVDGARAFWPWRMNKCNGAMGEGARRSHAAKCDQYVLDSNFHDETVTNRDVLDEAARLGADAAVLADVYHDMDATVGALLDGLDLAADHHYSGTVVLPLQAPHEECYRQVAASLGREDVWWAIGGQKDASAAAKLAATRGLRTAAGTDAHVHGLGFGVTDALARAVRAEPGLLDSIDNATAVTNAAFGIDGREEKATITAAFATAERLRALRALTPFADDSPEALRESGQTGLEELA